jgi:hypothetical protein
LLAAVDAQGVEGAADHVVAHTGEVADAAAADQHDRVLLQRVPLAGDVDRDFLAVRQPHAGDLPQGRVRLLGGHGPDLQTDAPLEGAFVEDRRFGELPLGPAATADELVDRGHENEAFTTIVRGGEPLGTRQFTQSGRGVKWTN